MLMMAPVPPQTPRQRDLDLVGTFDLACRRTGLTHDQVARLMGLTPEHLYQQLRQTRHLSLTRLLKMRDDKDGRRFLRIYLPMVCCDVDADLGQTISLADVLGHFLDTLQIRMARAQLAERDREGRVA